MSVELQKKIHEVQEALRQQKLDGWLLYDFRRTNDLACEFLGISSDNLLTRRFFYWVPQKGDPIKIVHAIEQKHLEHLPGKKILYRSWQELEAAVANVLQGTHRIAMEYSPRNAIPYVSKVDAGTMEIVRDCGVEVFSSADLLQRYTSVWDEHKLQTHLAAAEILDQTAAKTWEFITYKLQRHQKITEYEVQQFILGEFAEHNCVTDSFPICAVNAHSADPHYSPGKEGSSIIKQGDFVLIDLWCKQKVPDAVYADITRVAVAGSEATEKQREIFAIVKKARDAGTELVKSRFANGEPLMGWEVDRKCREVISDAGFGEFFIHRTGHNIGVHDHGNGAHLDDLETQDRRRLLEGTCFSIEPGIYLPGEFGVRLEYDVYVHHDGRVEVTGGIQNELECLMKRPFMREPD